MSTATLVALGAAPVMVAGATAVLDQESAVACGPRSRSGLALVGLVLLLGAPAGGASPRVGAALALVPAAAFATMTVVNRTPVAGLGPLELTGVSFTLGAALLAPAAIALGGPMRPTTRAGVALLVWLGLGPTALAYGAYFGGLRTVEGATASVVALLEPLTAPSVPRCCSTSGSACPGLVGGVLLASGIVVTRVAPTMAAGPRRD